MVYWLKNFGLVLSVFVAHIFWNKEKALPSVLLELGRGFFVELLLQEMFNSLASGLF